MEERRPALPPPIEPVRPPQPIEELQPSRVRVRRLIGEIFVDLGMIDEEQLHRALEAQRGTGARLGEILIEQGSVSRTDLAGALAAHWEPDPAAESLSPRTRRRSRSWPSLDREPGPRDRARSRRGHRPSGCAQASVESRLSDLEATIERLTALRTNDALATGARLASLEEQLAAGEKRKKHKKPKKGRRRSAAPEGARATAPPSPETEADDAGSRKGWVAFAPTREGYRLLEVPGVPPDVGATVTISQAEGALLVTRYGQSPIPFDARPCAFLDRVVAPIR